MNLHKYEVVSLLGAGGFGRVYLAWRWRPGGVRKLVAVKVLLAQMDHRADQVARLRDEAKVLALLRHRAIVGAHDLVRVQLSGEPGVHPAVILDYVEGADLGMILRSGGLLPLRCALLAIGEVADALAYALEAQEGLSAPLGLLHRDIKPSNIQLGLDGLVKLLDFGIARVSFSEREALSQEGLYGTLNYMAPERLDQRDLPASDVFSLGVTLMELLSGRSLGRLTPRPNALARRVEEAITALRAARPEIDEPTSALLSALLAFDPAARPTARELAQRCQALARSCAGPTLQEWAPSAVSQVRSRLPPRPRPSVEIVEISAEVESLMVEVELDSAETDLAPTDVPAVSAPPQEAPHGRWRVTLLAFALSLLLFSGALRAFSPRRLDPEPATPRLAEATFVERVATPDDPPPAEVASTPDPAADDSAAETTDPPTQPPPTRPRRPQGCEVSLEGARQVTARDGQRTFLLPGSVPVGSYQLELVSGGAPRLAGELVCHAKPIKLMCEPAFAQCTELR